jgi:hypothetical protein
MRQTDETCPIFGRNLAGKGGGTAVMFPTLLPAGWVFNGVYRAKGVVTAVSFLFVPYSNSMLALEARMRLQTIWQPLIALILGLKGIFSLVHWVHLEEKKRGGHKLVFSLFFLVILSSCAGNSNIEVGYQPPFIPIRVAVDRWGSVTASSSYQLSTLIGTFDLTAGHSIPAIRRNAQYPVLIVRVDNQVTVYELSPDNSFEVEFDDNQYYQKVNLARERDGDIILELQSLEVISIPGSSSGPMQKPYSNSCPGAFATRLSIGSRAKVVASPRLIVHEEPGENAPAVYGHSLSKGRTVTILGGPICDGGMLWWYIESGVITLTNGDRHNIIGWVAEESGDEWMLAPLH